MESYSHDLVVERAAHFDVFQVTVLDVICQFAGGAAVGTMGREQPIYRQGIRKQIGLRLEAQGGFSVTLKHGNQAQSLTWIHEHADCAQQRHLQLVETHLPDSNHFPVDLSHISAYDLLVLRQVHSEQMIVDQPQRHVTCKMGYCPSQLRDLVGRGSVQVHPNVHLCTKVSVLLTGERNNMLKFAVRMESPRKVLD